MPPTLYLIDGHALAYRTFFAMTSTGGDSMRTSSGEPTAAIFGFMNVLFRLLEKEKPEFLAVAFDTGRTFRNDIYPDYKATRAKMPDELRQQIERLRQIIHAFEIPCLEKENAEADDVLGTIAHQAVEKGLGVKIITGDRDLLQLVEERIIVNLPGRSMADSKDYKIQDVIDRMGVKPDQIVDLKGLMGDPSDNIPGVPGVGEKTALKLLTEYHSLDNIYQKLEEIPPKFKSKLEAGRDSAFMSKELARIHTDIDIALDIEKSRTDDLNFKAVESIFLDLEFRTLLTRLRDLESKASSSQPAQQLELFGEKVELVGNPSESPVETIIVDNNEILQDMLTFLKKADWISFDTETTDTDPMKASLVGISIAVEANKGYYIPVGHVTSESQLPINEVIDALKPVFENPKIKKAGHNMKYDGLMLLKHGIRVEPYSYDTMLAAWLIEPGYSGFGLKHLAERYLKLKMTPIEDLIGKGKNQKSMAEVSVEETSSYAAADAAVPLAIMPLLTQEMERKNVDHVFHTIEMPLVPVLADMELAGVSLDKAFFKKMEKELSTRLAEIEKEIYQMVGYHFNINSTQQLSVALFEKLALTPPVRKKTASGHYSTNVNVLEELRGKHPAVDLLLEYRELAKLQSTYVKALPEQINPLTRRVHSTFSQTGAVTGRLSSINPNLQNIPTRTEIGREVRKGFIAAPGCGLLAVDYSQVELRIVAHMSQDQAMQAAFIANQDIHAATAAAIYNVPLDQVTKDQRRHAKAINFGLIYGMSPFGLSRTTGLTLAEAENFVKAYFKQFPGVKKYLDQLRRNVMQDGYVETLLGRRRYFPNLSTTTNANARGQQEREAINAPIQGTAADIMKIAMINLNKALRDEKSNAKIILQVHDELILECPLEEKDKIATLTRSIMQNAYPLNIPLQTEERWGMDWGSLEVIPPPA
jgi:DNA polymerase-1